MLKGNGQAMTVASEPGGGAGGRLPPPPTILTDGKCQFASPKKNIVFDLYRLVGLL